MLGGQQPHTLLSDLAVFVGEDMPLRNHTPPGYFWVGLPEVWRDPAGRLAYDLHEAFDSELKHTILEVPRQVVPGRKRENPLRGVEHIPEIAGVSLVRPHRSPVSS